MSQVCSRPHCKGVEADTREARGDGVEGRKSHLLPSLTRLEGGYVIIRVCSSVCSSVHNIIHKLLTCWDKEQLAIFSCESESRGG